MHTLPARVVALTLAAGLFLGVHVATADDGRDRPTPSGPTAATSPPVTRG